MPQLSVCLNFVHACNDNYGLRQDSVSWTSLEYEVC